MTTHTCPQCRATYSNDDTYIAHRFLELAHLFDSYGEHDNAHAYRTKNPTHYRIVNGIIEKKVP